MRTNPLRSQIASSERLGGGVAEVGAVRLIDATKAYGGIVAVDSVSLVIKQRELFTLLGPSGSGKSTVLRMIAGLIRPSSGEIWIGNEEVNRRATYERDVALVFQSLALFPHMDVFSNIAFPLRMRRIGRREVTRRVRVALDTVQLPDIAHRRINELSGGQQQRVALARALVYEPKLLLLDEPLGALDRRLREEMQLEIVRLHREIDVTIVNVTHDQREALMLSDRIGVMRRGRLEQVGPSEDIYQHPRSRFVAEFLGDANLLDGVLHVEQDKGLLRTNSGATIKTNRLVEALIGSECAAVVRAESIDLLGDETSKKSWNRFSGTVTLRAFEGSATYYEVNVRGLTSTLKVLRPPSPHTFEVGDPVWVEWSPDNTLVVGANDDPMIADARQ